jgi:hypothetical protein
MLRDAGSMTTLMPVRSQLCRGGILYGQIYGLTKEIVDAASSRKRKFNRRGDFSIKDT